MYSPAEKYDLLVGDFNYTLTNKMKEEGNHVTKDEDGDVPEWMGHCHGWSAASINEPRPTKTVNITAADGKTVISFYPEDIKALATAFWAATKYETAFLGSRCEYSDFSEIPSDNETGLWEDYQCFTVNPASLVIAMANQLGIKKKSLVYDPDSNGEIWNQPVYGYNMTYFNPLTKKDGELAESKISMKQLREAIENASRSSNSTHASDSNSSLRFLADNTTNENTTNTTNSNTTITNTTTNTTSTNTTTNTTSTNTTTNATTTNTTNSNTTTPNNTTPNSNTTNSTTNTNTTTNTTTGNNTNTTIDSHTEVEDLVSSEDLKMYKFLSRKAASKTSSIMGVEMIVRFVF